MTIEAYLFKARLAEQLEMYKEMKEAMRHFVEAKYQENEKNGGSNKDLLAEDERNLLSVAYKNVVGQRRTSWRIMCSLEGKTEDEWKLEICREVKQQIETELLELCNEIIDLLSKYLLPSEDPSPDEDGQNETAVFFYKMKGDYLRYQVEISKDDERAELSDKAKSAYTLAEKVAENLSPTHPIRLGLALNFSVYYYEIAQNPQEACDLAKKAFDQAIAKLDSTSEDTYKDSTLILQLLRDNLSLWTADENDQEDK